MTKLADRQEKSLRVASFGLLLFALIFFTYFRVLSFSFVSVDDGIHLFENPFLRPPNFSNWIENWRGPYKGLYIPLTYSFWQAVAKLNLVFGEPTFLPASFHLANVVVHAINSFLVFLLIRFWLKEPLAFFGAAFFALHPLQVEPVAWCSGMKDLLATAFALGACLAHLKAVSTRNLRWEFLTYFAFFLALLSKPSVTMLPLLFLVVDLFLHESWGAAGVRFFVGGIISLPFVFMTRVLQPESVLAFIPTLSERVLIAADAYVFYLSKLLFPWGLTLDYGRNAISSPGPLIWVLGATAVLLGGLFWRRRQWLLFLGLFALALSPSLGFLPFYYQKYSTVADRFVYLALLVPAFAFGLWMRRSQTTNFLRFYLGLGFLAALIPLAGLQTKIWANDLTLYQRMAKINPTAVNFFNLGRLIEEKWRGGHPGLDKLPSPILEEVRANYYAALENDPKYSRAYHNLGVLASIEGESQKATAYYRKALEFEPGSADTLNNLGIILAERGEVKEAAEFFEKALALKPSLVDAHFNLGLAYEKTGQWAKSVFHYEKAISHNHRSHLALEHIAQVHSLASAARGPQ